MHYNFLEIPWADLAELFKFLVNEGLIGISFLFLVLGISCGWLFKSLHYSKYIEPETNLQILHLQEDLLTKETTISLLNTGIETLQSSLDDCQTEYDTLYQSSEQTSIDLAQAHKDLEEKNKTISSLENERNSLQCKLTLLTNAHTRICKAYAQKANIDPALLSFVYPESN